MVDVSGSTKSPASGPPGASQAPSPRPPAAADPHADRLDALVERLAGDIVLRHIRGRRVLDVGHGAPQIATWVRQRAAAFEIVDRSVCRTPTPAIAHPDASFDLVVCLKTLPYVGVDEQSSEPAARGLLAEIARVLVPGGYALVDIDNPRSFRGAYHGVRNPKTMVEMGALTVETDRGLARFDTLGRFLDMLPPRLALQDFHGLQVLLHVPHALDIPIVGQLLGWAEWLARDSPLVRRFGAHLLCVLRKLPQSVPQQ